MALNRPLGVSYPPGWRIHHKLTTAIGEQEESYRLQGAVQIAGAHPGGERGGGKAGRGSEHKVAYVAAVSLTEYELLLLVKLTPAPRCTFRAQWDWSRQH